MNTQKRRVVRETEKWTDSCEKRKFQNLWRKNNRTRKGNFERKKLKKGKYYWHISKMKIQMRRTNPIRFLKGETKKGIIIAFKTKIVKLSGGNLE